MDNHLYNSYIEVEKFIYNKVFDDLYSLDIKDEGSLLFKFICTEERERLQKEIAQAESDVNRMSALLANSAFVAKAPQKLVDGEREKLAKAEERLAKLREKLAALD